MLVLWACIAKPADEEPVRQRTVDSLLHFRSLTLKARKVVKPVYPGEALRLGIRGTVIVVLIIDKQGQPRNIRTTKGDALLARSVLNAVQKWRWHPYRINRQTVEVEMTIAVSFEPGNEAPLSPETSFALCRW